MSEEEEDKHKEEEQQPEEGKPKSSIKEEMKRFRADLDHYRTTYFNELEGYEKIKNDDSYDELKKQSNTTDWDDVEITRFYPNVEEIFKPRPPVKNSISSINWNKETNKVYIKEFDEDDEVVKAQIAQMKGEMDTSSGLLSGDLGKQINKQLKGLQEEIPLNKRDIERYIGENLVFKLAVAIILVGVIVLYQYSISMGYINEYARVAVGITIGTAFCVWAHYHELNGKSKFTPTLVTLGIITLYYTVRVSFSTHEILSQTQGFIGGIIVTGIAIFLAMLYNEKRLSILAILGGYLTPFLVSTGEGNYVYFFSYVLLFNLAMLIIAHIKKWQVINSISILSTSLFLVIWTTLNPFDNYGEYIGLLAFSSLSYLLFFAAIFTYSRHKKLEVKSFDFYMLAFVFGMFIFSIYYAVPRLAIREYMPHILSGIAAFQAYFSFVLYRKESLEVIAWRRLALSSLLVANLAGLYGINHPEFYNTFWALQAIFLTWLGIQLEEKFVRDAAMVVLLLAIASLLYSWSQTYWSTYEITPTFIINKGMWASFVTLCASLISVLLYSGEEELEVLGMEVINWIKIISVTLSVIGYLTGLFELLWHTPQIQPELRMLMVDVYSMGYLFFYRFIIYNYKIDRLKVSVGGLMVISVIFYIFFGQNRTLELRDAFVNNNGNFWSFGFHYINLALSALLVITIMRDITSGKEWYRTGKYAFVMWFLCAVIVFHSTYELEHTIVLIRYAFTDIGMDEFLSQVRLTGFSILWSVISSVLMYFGITKKLKELRVISLVLFTITIAKFLIFDFWYMQAIWKIISAISIGILLLIVSQMYGKLRNLINSGELIFDKDKVYSQEESAEMIRYAQARRDMLEEDEEDDIDDKLRDIDDMYEGDYTDDEEYEDDEDEDEWR
ncbi:DUF2339 domain-containing protein [Flammeovirgaceae bacterium SG7u.111]|nr:DUF2339 domain-containing protein [Flammeovirgaceae bacterium SG7u.132]WPO38500.1 DUF2339 domain-containing protein [Flammeovirgaceae bacterium SG7u.111]